MGTQTNFLWFIIGFASGMFFLKAFVVILSKINQSLMKEKKEKKREKYVLGKIK